MMKFSVMMPNVMPMMMPNVMPMMMPIEKIRNYYDANGDAKLTK